jgi:uncharacterized membrane protein
MRRAAAILAASLAILAPGMGRAAPPVETPAAPMACGGSEPFWSLTLDAEGNAKFSDGDGREIASRYTMLPSRNTTLMTSASFADGSIRAVITNNSCVESMSDANDDDPYEIAIFYDGKLLSGCCNPG